MPIFLRGDVYWIDIRHQGKRIRKTAGTADREAAQRFHDQLKADLWRLEHLDEPLDRTFSQAVDKWLTENGHKKYMRDQSFKLDWLNQRIGDMPLRKITTRTVEDLIERKQAERWRGKPVSNATINRHLSALSVVLKSAHKWVWIKELPTIRELPEPESRERYFTREQVVALVAELPWHLACIFTFAIHTGQRMSNILGLRWAQVDIDNACFWITSDEFKGNRAHNVPLSAEALAVLALCAGNDDDFVFVYRGKPIKRMTEGWQQALERLGLKGRMRFHDTRHTWASFHIMNGTPKEVLLALGGWKTPAMVERYAHLAPGFAATYAGNVKLK